MTIEDLIRDRIANAEGDITPGDFTDETVAWLKAEHGDEFAAWVHDRARTKGGKMTQDTRDPLSDPYGDDEAPEPDDHTREAMVRLVRWYVRASAQLEAMRGEYMAEIRRLSDRLDLVSAPLATRVMALAEQIRQCALARLAEDPKVKTWHLPHGTVRSTTRQPEVFVADDAALLAWAEDNAPELVVRKPVIDKRAAKAALTILPDGETVVTEHGEKVPGVIVKPLTTTVSVTPAEQDSEFT